MTTIITNFDVSRVHLDGGRSYDIMYLEIENIWLKEENFGSMKGLTYQINRFSISGSPLQECLQLHPRTDLRKNLGHNIIFGQAQD